MKTIEYVISLDMSDEDFHKIAKRVIENGEYSIDVFHEWRENNGYGADRFDVLDEMFALHVDEAYNTYYTEEEWKQQREFVEKEFAHIVAVSTFLYRFIGTEIESRRSMEEVLEHVDAMLLADFRKETTEKILKMAEEEAKELRKKFDK